MPAMMKNALHILGIFTVLAVAGVFAAGPRSAAASDTVSLTYATNTEPVGLRGMAEKGFIEEIQRLGKGRVRIRVYWRQSYLIDKEILEGVKDGSVDMGHVNINYYPNRLLVNGGITLLQRGPEPYDQRMRAYDRIYGEIPELNAEFARYNQKIIYTYAVLPMAGCFTRKAVSLDDFRDRRIRTASRWLLKVLEGTGAIPVGIPWADSYIALKTNALEGVYTNLDAIHRVGLDRVAPHVVIFRELWNPVPFHITVNLARWNRLAPGVRNIIQTAAQNARERFAREYAGLLDTIVADQRAAGIHVAFASKMDVHQWLSMEEIEKVKAQWVKEVNLVRPSVNAGAILENIEKIVAQVIDEPR
ncbi:MAG: hypothetical protein V6Z89_01165 [Desulfobacter sp.]